jgi:endonuclease
MSIYEKPTKDLMHIFAAETLKPGQIFGKMEAVKWFAQRYPKIRDTTVRMHVDGMSVNSPNRKHHMGIKPGKNFDLFYKVGPAQYRLWDPATDPAPVYGKNLVDATSIEDKGEAIDESRMSDEDADSASQFAYETDLRDYLARNLGKLEPGLALYQDEDGAFDGVEFQADGRRIDILARDRNGVFVVIELKVSRGHERTIGQLLGYMGWVKAKLADGKDVRGIIVARSVDKDLKFATSMVNGVMLVEYEIDFRLKSVG